VKTNEGVVLGVEKKLPSKLMEPSKSEKLVEVSIKVIWMVLTIFYGLPKYLTNLLCVD
jgi:20S proteasome alpha/beta subunit